MYRFVRRTSSLARQAHVPPSGGRLYHSLAEWDALYDDADPTIARLLRRGTSAERPEDRPTVSADGDGVAVRSVDSLALPPRELGARVKENGRKRKGPFFPVPRGSEMWEELFGKNDKLFELERSRVQTLREELLAAREADAVARADVA
mmetsp:Transcript_6811/g.21947  ORF Transcript_6811/g.21947 Transcript_6811/m.21947 type:complete len:149 (-) Transcript_6811:995-1441(-)